MTTIKRTEMRSVLVLLSTYNGEKYLREQIDSVLNQEGVKVSLLIRDDGSKDETINILKEYASRENVNFYEGQNCGPSESFHDLLNHAQGYDYYAFCDQDDVWIKDKLVKATDCLDNMNQATPNLYCSNLNVVDENLRFCRICHVENYNLNNRYQGLIELFAVGCTEVFNQKAVDMTLQYWSNKCLMHDSWIFMICNFLGKVFYDNSSHINYRQHGGNVIGAEKNFIGKVKASSERVITKRIQPRWQNANAIIESLSEIILNKDVLKIKKMANYKESIISRIRLFFDFDIRAASLKNDLKYRFLIIVGLI